MEKETDLSGKNGNKRLSKLKRKRNVYIDPSSRRERLK